MKILSRIGWNAAPQLSFKANFIVLLAVGYGMMLPIFIRWNILAFVFYTWLACVCGMGINKLAGNRFQSVLRILWRCFLVGCMIGIFAVSFSTDITICSQCTHWDLKVIPVEPVGGMYEKVRKRRASGEKENVDFVIYHGTGVSPPKRAIVIMVP